MKVYHAFMTAIAISSTAFSIWVPVTHQDDYPGHHEGIHDPPGGYQGNNSYVWIEIPDIPNTVVPGSRTSTGPNENAREESESARRNASIPRFNDVSADVEYGFISFKNDMFDTFGGFGIAARAKYERRPDDYSGYGVRVNNEFTRYTAVSWDIPGSNFLLIGPFYRRSLTTNFEVGGQANISMLLRKDWSDKLSTEWAYNPTVYGIYTFTQGPFSGHAGAFAGYSYSEFSHSPHQFPYAALFSAGTSFGDRIALQTDIAVSHRFLIIGAQMPIYLSHLFSLTPGVKYPLVFEATKLQNIRATVGVSSRW